MEIKITGWETAFVHGRVSPVGEASPLRIGAQLVSMLLSIMQAFIAGIAARDGGVRDHRSATERLHRDFGEYHVNSSP